MIHLLTAFLMSLHIFGGTPVFGATPALTIPQGGTGTTTFTGGKLLAGSSPLRLMEVSTTSASCSGSASCSSFTIIGTTPVTISASGGAAASAFEIATTSTIGNSQLAFFSQTSGRTTLSSIATSTGTVSTPLTGNFICVGSGCTLGIQAASASQNGYESSGDYNLGHAASTTFSGALVYSLASNGVTCTTATASVPGCLAAADFTTFAAKLSSYDAFTHPNNFSTTTSATSSSIWLQGGSLFSSSTVASQFPYASTTAFSIASTEWVGTGGAGNSTIQFGPSLNEWVIGYDNADKSFEISSSTALGTLNALKIDKVNSRLTFSYASSTGTSASFFCLTTCISAFTSGTVTAVTGTYPIISSGGTTPAISTAFGTTTNWGIANNTFIVTGSTGIPYGAASSSLSLPNTALQNSSITLNSGTNLSGGGTVSLGGSLTLVSTGPVATSASETNGQLAFWTTLNGTPAKLGSVATGTVSSSGGVTVTANRSAIGGALAISCDVATASVPGCLAAADFTTFAAKLSGYDAFTHGATFSTTTSATSTSIWTAGVFFSTSTAASSQFPYASTTAITATNASTTAFTISGISGVANNCLQVSTIGVVSGAGSACSTSANPGFTFSTIFGTANTAATTSQMQITGGLAASSTIRFGNAGVLSQFLWDGPDGWLGLASTTPTATLSVGGGTATSSVLIGGGTASTSVTIAEYDYGLAGRLATSTAMTIGPDTAATIQWPMGTANLTLTLCNFKSGQQFNVVIVNPNSVSGTVTWAVCSGSQLYWSGGGATAPTHTTTANFWDYYSFKARLSYSPASTTAAMIISGAQTANF